MGLKVGELYVDLGVKGADKTIGSISDTTKGMSGLASMSLEAKAAVLAAMYGLERMMSTSSAMGSHLVNLSTLLGIPMKTLQQYDYAAQQVGISNGEMEGSFKSLSSVMENIKFGHAPEFANIIMGAVGMDKDKMWDKKTGKADLSYVMQKLQEFARLKNFTEADKLKYLSSFVGSENVVSGLMQNAFKPKVLASAPFYHDGQAKRLQKLQADIANLEQRIDMKFGAFFAKHGHQLIGDIDKVSTSVMKLVESFDVLAEKVKLFEWIGKIFDGWSLIFNGAASGVDQISGAVSDPKKRDKLEENILGFFKQMPSVFIAMGEELVTPNVQPSIGAKVVHNHNVQQSLQFSHDGRDHQKNAESHKKALRDAYSQFPALNRGA